MKRILLLTGSVLFATLLVAQQDPVAKPATAAERMQALRDKQQQMIDEWRAAAKAAGEAAKAAKDSGAPMPAMPMRPDFAPLIAGAQAAAADFAGTEDAVPFLVMVVQNTAGTDKEALKAALDTLIAHHVDSPALADLGGMMLYLDQLLDAADAKKVATALAGSKNPDVSGWALFAQHKNTIENASRDGAEYKHAKELLLAALAKVDNEPLKREITSAIDTREKFGVGVTAPDIVGEDLDGVAFKLSDYKGKVLFLDFWGDW